MKVVPRLERKSSIENEPRTLNIRQIQIAREAALYVVSTRSMEEALRIFTEGLEPVLKCASGNNHEEEDGEEEQEDKNMELRHDCGYEEEFGSLSWDQSSRDIVTAPF